MNNPVHLKIGLLGYEPTWKLLLDQIGVDWNSIESFATLSPFDYSIIIINHPLTPVQRQSLTEYTTSGGAIIYTCEEGTHVANNAIANKYISSIAPQNFNEYKFSDIFDIYNRTYLFEYESLIKVEQIGKGFISYLGVNVRSMLNNDKPKRKSFYAHRKRLPHERVAKSTKSALRQLVQSHLEFLHHKRNLPFVHKWFYPKDHQTLFTFRIDSDKGTQTQIDAIFQLSEHYQIPTTWFLDVKSHESWLDYFRKFDSQEIGVHCYEHSVYNSTVLNKENFEKALILLQRHELQPRGIAAPTGAWNKAIGNAIRELGFSYSSEFSYDYDNLPSFPILDSEFSSAVQLPVHPMCVGTMRRERMSSEEMVQYFLSVVDNKINRCEPICLYHHPAHATNEVFEEVFRYINDKKILTLSYLEYAEWWKQRNRFTFSASYAESKIAFDHHDSSDGTFVRISLPTGKEKICSAQTDITFDGSAWVAPTERFTTPQDIMRARKTVFRHYIQNALDWWIKITE